MPDLFDTPPYKGPPPPIDAPHQLCTLCGAQAMARHPHLRPTLLRVAGSIEDGAFLRFDVRLQVRGQIQPRLFDLAIATNAYGLARVRKEADELLRAMNAAGAAAAPGEERTEWAAAGQVR